MKIWAYLALAVILIAALTAGIRYIDKNGYNRAVSEMQADAIERQNTAIEAARLEWEATREEAEVVIVIEEKIVEKIRVVIKEVPKIVEKFVQLECRDLGLEYAGLLNSAVRASNSRSDPGAAATTELADPL